MSLKSFDKRNVTSCRVFFNGFKYKKWSFVIAFHGYVAFFTKPQVWHLNNNNNNDNDDKSWPRNTNSWSRSMFLDSRVSKSSAPPTQGPERRRDGESQQASTMHRVEVLCEEKRKHPGYCQNKSPVFRTMVLYLCQRVPFEVIRFLVLWRSSRNRFRQGAKKTYSRSPKPYLYLWRHILLRK